MSLNGTSNLFVNRPQYIIQLSNALFDQQHVVLTGPGGSGENTGWRRSLRDIYGLCGFLVRRGKAVIYHKKQKRYHWSRQSSGTLTLMREHFYYRRISIIS
jgi:hypothetical protein